MKYGKYYWEQKFESTKELFSKRPNWMSVYDNDIPSAAFIRGLIEEYKPQNILEIGAAAGWSAYYMLSEALSHNNSFLTSVDIDSKLYYASDKPVGAAFYEINPDFKDNWKLVTQKCALEYLSENNGGLYDFVFIDANHYHPWAALDFLSVIPFLKNGAVVVFHDVFLNCISLGLQSSYWHPPLSGGDSNRGPYILYKLLDDEMVLSYDEFSPNVAALEFDSSKLDVYLSKILYSLYLPWEQVFFTEKECFSFYSLLISYVNFIQKYFSGVWADKFAQALFTSFKALKDSQNQNPEFEKILRRLELLYIAKPETKIMFWGASVFLEALLEQNELCNYNIIGIIDKNPDKKGQNLLGYNIFLPDDIPSLKPEVIIPSVINHNNVNQSVNSFLNSIGYDCMVL